MLTRRARRKSWLGALAHKGDQMIIRFLVLFLTVVAAGVFAQGGIFGPVSVRLKAGDFAPDMVFTEILGTGAAAPWTSASLSGRLTVLVFFPDTSHNLQSITMWNALVEQFADKPVQFAWVTGECQPPLGPWLQEHPIKGWVFLDPLGATALSYGMESPAAVIIGADRRIVGYDPAMLPAARTLNAALEGRIATEAPKQEWAAFKAFMEGGMALLEPEPPRWPRPEDHRPDFPPSYTLHVSPAAKIGGGDFASDDYRSFQGFDLKDVLARLYDTNPVRILLPAPLDDGKRYDFAIVLPVPESRESIHSRIVRGIEDHFGVATARERRMTDVYVATAPGRKPPVGRALPREDDGFSMSAGVTTLIAEIAGSGDPLAELPRPVGIGGIGGISVDGSAEDFCRTLERELDRPVVNETKLKGEFSFRVDASPGATNDFLDRLREESGIVITPAQREVEAIVLKAR